MTQISLVARIIIDVFLVASCAFAGAGVLGMLRLSDVYSRMQSSTIISVVWFMALTVAGLVYGIFVVDNWAMSVKLLLVGLFTVLTAPIIGHAMARAAYIYGERPYRSLNPDAYGQDRPWERDAVKVAAEAKAKVADGVEVEKEAGRWI